MLHCNNIRQFSIAVYHFMTEIFSYRLTFSEIGLTDHFLLDLARYSRISKHNNLEIYKMPWTVESVYGNDIDLFIQNNLGTFNWYALQAKVMSFNGAFKDLKYKPSSKFQQWDKLLSHETTFGSKTYYLLYCGKFLSTPNTLTTRNDCIGLSSMHELGLSIVETQVVKSIRTTINQSQQFYFKYVFPTKIDSIRKLFCCTSALPETTKKFQKWEIDTSGYQRIYSFNRNNFEDNGEQFENQTSESGKAPIRIIVFNKGQSTSH